MMNKIHFVTFLLIIVGGLNWLLVGLFGWDLGMKFFGGQDTTISKVIYILVGLSAVYEVATHKQICKLCSAMMGKKSGM